MLFNRRLILKYKQNVRKFTGLFIDYTLSNQKILKLYIKMMHKPFKTLINLIFIFNINNI